MKILLTLRSSSRRPRHSRVLQTLVVTQKPSTRLTTASNEAFGTLTCLSNLYNVLQLRLPNLRTGQYQLSPPPNRLCLLQLLNLGITSGYKFSLMT